MSLTVYTSCYGLYEDPKPIHASPLVDRWLFYTDSEETAAAAREMGWEAHIEPRPGEPPFLAAKLRKCHPPEGCEHSLWLDGSVLVRSDALFYDALLMLERGIMCDIATYKHPYRDCILDEAIESEYTPRYRTQRVLWQAAKYMQAGHPRHGGLYSTGIIARTHTPEVLELGKRWWKECQVTCQDQVSFPVVAREYGKNIGVFDNLGHGGIYDSPSFLVCAHKRELPMGTPEAAQ